MATEAEKEAPPQWPRWPTAEPTLSFEAKPLPAALTQSPPPVSEPERPTRWVWIVLGISAVSALGAGAGYYLLTQPRPTPLVAQSDRPVKPAAAPVTATAPVPAAAPATATATAPAADTSAPQLAVGLRPLGEPRAAPIAAPPAPGPASAAPAAPAEAPTYAIGLRPITPPARPPAQATDAPPPVAMSPPADPAVAPRPAPRRKAVAHDAPQRDQPSRTVNSIRF